MTVQTWIPTAALALLVVASGCNLESFCLDCETRVTDDSGVRDGRTDDGGGGNGDGGGGNGDGGECTEQPEVCDGEDNDCDGAIDEGTLPSVGAACGTDEGQCSTGIFECTNGELVCGGNYVAARAEECNDLDDDCDGMVDDGDPGGGVVCGSLVGECERGVTACIGGSVICQGEITPTNEVCNGLDDDCDGLFDEGNPGGGAACGNVMGSCAPGTEQCIGGAIQCVGGTGPSFELCDGADNDCDTLIDETFDLDIDPNHCGSCTTVCAVDNGQAGCAAGDCNIAFCFTGFWDLNTTYSDGCEYECDFLGEEVCNGRDDDCDGDVDEDLTTPDICTTIGECAGTVASCADDGNGTVSWTCPYGLTVSTDAAGAIIPETDCDGLDNDCDGVADDNFSTLGDACSRGQGLCTTNGVVVCNGNMDGIRCDAADPGTGSTEICNGVDDDCDGDLDEGAPDLWVQVAGNLWTYQYEASRPDATSSIPGSMAHRPCSAAGRLPWTNVTHPQASAACAAVGASLCSESQWQQACQGQTGSCTWAYATNCDTYVATTCNGNDYDFDPGTPGVDDDGVLPGGTVSNACFADFGAAGSVFDMSGNVKEWTLERQAGVNPLRGGSFNNTATGISCTFDFVVADDDFQFDNVGFRCCRTTAP